MVKKLYLDGCSLIHGYGLPRDKSLGYLFDAVGNYRVTDLSRSGKSNMAIAVDAYKNFNNHDVFVLGFTFASRFGIQYQNQNLDFFTGFHGKGLDLMPTETAEEIDHAYMQVYKYFYTVFEPPFCNTLSDMLIDGLISFLKSQNKKVVAVSWESRNTQQHLHYPYMAPKHRLEDGHFNEAGTRYLFDFLQNIIDE